MSAFTDAFPIIYWTAPNGRPIVIDQVMPSKRGLIGMFTQETVEQISQRYPGATIGNLAETQRGDIVSQELDADGWHDLMVSFGPSMAMAIEGEFGQIQLYTPVDESASDSATIGAFYAGTFWRIDRLPADRQVPDLGSFAPLVEELHGTSMRRLASTC